MSVLPFLLGPISLSDGFMLASIQTGNVPCVLLGTSGSISSYYWESNLTKILSSSKIAVFNANGQLNALTLKDTTNGGYLGFTSNSAVTNVDSPSNIVMSQTIYRNWNPPDIFLSGVYYSMYNQTTLATISYNNVSIPADNIVILPILWYTNCSSNGDYTSINTPPNSIQNWFCIITPSDSNCQGFITTKKAWTTSSECINGSFYIYCKAEQTCGADNCNGPCPLIYDDCVNSSNNFKCVLNPIKYLLTVKWYTSPYFIGAIIAIIVIIIILIVLIFAVFRHGKKTTSQSTQITQSTQLGLPNSSENN